MYCTVSDIENAITRSLLALRTDDANGKIVNEGIVNSFIQSTSDTIDNYLRGRYTLPLNNYHDILKKVCIDLTVYELAKRRGKASQDERQDYDDAHSMLYKIQKGIVLLQENTTELKVSQSGTIGIFGTKSPSVFSTVDKFKQRFR